MFSKLQADQPLIVGWLEAVGEFVAKNDPIDAVEALRLTQSRLGTAPGPGMQEMLAKVGRNLVLFNQIESALKYVLPYIDRGESIFGPDNLVAMQAALTKQPLGNLAKAMAALIDPDREIGLADYLSTAVDSRNRLVHHLFQVPGVSLIDEGPANAIKWLDEQYELCFPLKHMADQLIAALLYALERQAQANGEELAIEEWRDQLT